MTENVNVSEIVSSSVARDMDITNDDRTYLVLTARGARNTVFSKQCS